MVSGNIPQRAKISKEGTPQIVFLTWAAIMENFVTLNTTQYTNSSLTLVTIVRPTR